LPSGGGKRALYYHVRGLVERGHQVEIWCPDTADVSYLPLTPFGPEHVLPLAWKHGQIVPGRIARLLPTNRESSRKIAALNAHCQQVGAQIEAGNFDLLFANSCTVTASSPIARYVSIPTALYLQEPNRPLYEARPLPPWAALWPDGSPMFSRRHIRTFIADYIKVWNMRELVREEVANAAAFDAILVNSYFSRESVRSAYGLNSRVCYLGIDHHHFAGAFGPRENYAVGLGTLIYVKNARFVIEALGQVPEPRPLLIWIGNGADSTYLQEMKELAKNRGVEFEPKVFVTDEELRSYLTRASMMLYAPVLEPFGFAPLEANACGTPVIAVAEGGVRETVIDGLNGLVVAPDPAAMAAGIVRLRDDTAYARKLGAAAQEHVAACWSLSAAMDRLEECFEDVLRKKATPGTRSKVAELAPDNGS